MNVPLMVDLSSNNPPVDLTVHYRAGYRTLALKATEATGYRWSDADIYADQWHALGGRYVRRTRLVRYHFGRDGDPVAQARYFVADIRPHWRRGDTVCLDAETHGVDGKFCRAFIDEVTRLLGRVRGLIYASPAFADANGITPHRGWRLWLADWSNHPHVPTAWRGKIAAWQFTDHATRVPGIPGPVDCSHLRMWMRPVALWPTLRPGARGPWVHLLQGWLRLHGYRIAVDGVYGPQTRKAVDEFKKRHRWRADGVVGYRMWLALDAA